MEAAHLGSGNRICTVVFADIVQYAEESVSRQVEMKAAFSVDPRRGARALAGRGPGRPRHRRRRRPLLPGRPRGCALRRQQSSRRGDRGARVARGARPAAPPRDQPGAGARRERHQRAQQRHRRRHQRGPAGHELRRAKPDPRLALLLRGRVAARPGLRPALPVRGPLTATSTCASTRSTRCTWRRRLAARRRSRRTAGTRRRPIPRSLPRLLRSAAVRLDPACIERLASALAREIGPVAKLIVRRAAERAADEGALDGRRGRARARREPRQLSRPSVGPAGTAARLGGGPAGAGHRGGGSVAIAGVSSRPTGPEASDPRSSPGSSRC